MYRPRPAGGREQIVFDFGLRSRLSELSAEDAALFICDSAETIESFAPFAAEFPALKMLALIANPPPYEGAAGNTPERMGWKNASQWRRYARTDRWRRIDTALRVGQQIGGSGYLVMPAHDAVWGRGLLGRMAGFSQRWARGGVPAAVSPYTYWQHSPVPGADVPQDVIDLLNTA